ncbi:MAG: hypothetical protein ACAI25_17015, partial [Planctomycetota bacterium]
ETLDVVSLNPALPSFVFRSIARPLLEAERPAPLVLATRSDAGTRPHALRRIAQNLDFLAETLGPRAAFVTPGEALELWLEPQRARTRSRD